MSKRGAENQGRRETGLEESWSATPKSDMAQRATAAQLAQRKILDTKRRKRPGPGPSPAPSQSNPFANFNTSSTSSDQNKQQQQEQSTSGFGSTVTNSISFGAQSASFPSNQPSTSLNSFNFTTQASSSFPPPSSTGSSDTSKSTASSNPFGGFQGSIFNIPPANPQQTPQAQPSPFQPVAPASNNHNTSDLSMHDDSGLEAQTTPKPTFTFGSTTGQVNPTSLFGQASGNPFASFGSVTDKTTQAQQSKSQSAEAPKGSFTGFGQKENEPSKTFSGVFAPSGAQTNGLSASSVFGAFNQQKDNSSGSTPTLFGASGSQPNNVPPQDNPSTDKAEPSKPTFNTPASSTPGAAFPLFGTQSTAPAPGPSNTAASNAIFSSSTPKPSDNSTSNAPEKLSFTFARAGENAPAAHATPQNPAISQQTSATDGQTEEPQSSSSTKPSESGRSPGSSKTSALFSRLAESQSSTSAEGNADDTPKPKFTFGTLAGKAQNAPQGSSASSSIFAPNPSQSTPVPPPTFSALAGVASASHPKDSQAPVNQISGSVGNIFQRSGSPTKLNVHDEAQKTVRDQGEKRNDTTNETPRPSFSLNTTAAGLEDPFTGPAGPRITGQAPRMPTTNIFARSGQSTTTSAPPNTHTRTVNSSAPSDASSGLGADTTVSQSAGPLQKIKLSSHGPSNIPSYLDNDTRADVDSGHRLRSLNQGLVDFLKSLDPSTDDFGRAIEYYCDARQALGKPLKFHQRASAGEKRKASDQLDTENVDRAPKRLKSSDGQTTFQPSLEATSVSSISDQSRNTTSAVAEVSAVGSSSSKPVAEHPTSQPLFGQTNTQALGHPHNIFNNVGKSSSTNIFAPKPSEQQQASQHSDKQSSSSSLFGQSQPNTSNFGQISSSSSSTPKPPEKQTTPQSSFKSINASSIFSQPQATSSTFGGTFPSKAFGSNTIEEQQDQRHDAGKNDTDATQLVKQAVLNASNVFSKPVEKRKAAELSSNENNIPEVSRDDHSQALKKAKVDMPENGHNDEDSQEDGSGDESSGAEDDASQDPTYEPDDEDGQAGDQDEEDESDGDENDLQKAMDDSRKIPGSEVGHAGKSLFDRIEPNPNKQSEDSNLKSTGASSAAEGAVKPSAPSLFGKKTGETNQSSTSNFFSTRASDTSQPSSFTPSASSVFGSSGKNTSNLFGSPTFGQKWGTADSSMKAASKSSPLGTPSLGVSNGFSGSGLFGSRPATPDEEANDKARPHGSSIFDNAPKFVGDQTFKEGTPIKFANANTLATPSVNVTAPSPKGEKTEKGSLSKPNGGLFGFDNHKSQPETKPGQTSLGFNFANPPSLAPPFFPTSSLTSSANTSRATSPGATDTDSAADGVEEGTTETQVNLMDSRPGEENDEILFDIPRARAFYLDQGWKHKAYGPLRILKDRETGKTRILFRTDPGSQVIVNSLLVPSFEYKATASGGVAGSITCMVPKEGGVVESWLFKNGKLEKTQELAAIMEANKNN